ncbi:MAG: response regulator, partial [Thermodesulfobacteriota bacterium]|nr:response regulator [Thermodesulfobacteriota bacterium]
LPGIDGLSATQVIKQDPVLKEIPVIAVTAHAMQGDNHKAIEAGCHGYISKPIDTRSFSEKIGQFLQEKSTNQKVIEGKETNHKSKILIVDDKPLNVKLLAAIIPVEEYQIIKAYDGMEALEKSLSESPDLILLDILMPGMDGYEVTKKLKEDSHTRYIPIVLITSLDEEEDKVKGLEAGADEFLNKPVNPHELLARVRSLILLKQYREELSKRVQTQQTFALSTNHHETTQADKDLPVILVVEDNKSDAMLIKHSLHGQPYRIKLVRDGDEAISYIRKERVDLLLLDILLPHTDGFEVCRCVKDGENTKTIQIVLITCLSDLEIKIKGINLGADDFLVKPINQEEIKARVKALLKKKAYLDQLNTNYEIALNSAMIDKLTNVYNQSYFKHFLEFEMKRSQRDMRPIALALIDIDDFKQYNDILGHLAGDQILKMFTRLLIKNVREVDLLARYGGDEFAVIMSSADEEKARNIAERIRSEVWKHDFPPCMSLPDKKLSTSMGIAFCPKDAKTVNELIEKSDKALYKAKKEGKNRVCIYSEHLRGTS